MIDESFPEFFDPEDNPQESICANFLQVEGEVKEPTWYKTSTASFNTTTYKCEGSSRVMVDLDYVLDIVLKELTKNDFISQKMSRDILIERVKKQFEL